MDARSITISVLALGAVPLLAACGESQSDRALSGAAIGGAAGAAFDRPLLGAAGGAAAGALTDPDDINLGKPVWR
jgi:osmotically inducible lipoprotein OsmB